MLEPPCSNPTPQGLDRAVLHIKRPPKLKKCFRAPHGGRSFPIGPQGHAPPDIFNSIYILFIYVLYITYIILDICVECPIAIYHCIYVWIQIPELLGPEPQPPTCAKTNWMRRRWEKGSASLSREQVSHKMEHVGNQGSQLLNPEP